MTGTVKRKHPVFETLTVVDAGTRWDYGYVFRMANEKGPLQASRFEAEIGRMHKDVQGEARNVVNSTPGLSELKWEEVQERLEHIPPFSGYYQDPTKLGDAKSLLVEALGEASAVAGAADKPEGTSAPPASASPSNASISQRIRRMNEAKSGPYLDIKAALWNFILGKTTGDSAKQIIKDSFIDLLENSDSPTTVDDLFGNREDIKIAVAEEVRKTQPQNGWVAVFAVPGRALYRGVDGSFELDKAGQPKRVTLGDVWTSDVNGQSDADVETMIAAKLNESIKKSLEEQAADTSNTDPSIPRTAQQIADFLVAKSGSISGAAQKIRAHIASVELCLIQPTDIPRQLIVPENSPFIKVNKSPLATSVRQALYTQIAAANQSKVNVAFSGEKHELHHVVPLYLGGSHELESLLRVYGSAGTRAADSIHADMHRWINQMSLTACIQTMDTPPQSQEIDLPSLSDKDIDNCLTTHGALVQIGTLLQSGSISYRETNIAYSGPKSGGSR